MTHRTRTAHRPKFRTGQWVWCLVCARRVKILRMRGGIRTSCSPMGEVDADTELRPLTKRECGA
jgi:hypothetical protein